MYLIGRDQLGRLSRLHVERCHRQSSGRHQRQRAAYTLTDFRFRSSVHHVTYYATQ